MTPVAEIAEFKNEEEDPESQLKSKRQRLDIQDSIEDPKVQKTAQQLFGSLDKIALKEVDNESKDNQSEKTATLLANDERSEFSFNGNGIPTAQPV